MVAASIPFTNPTICPLDAFSLSLFAILIAKAIRPIVAHKVIVDAVKANNNRAMNTDVFDRVTKRLSEASKDDELPIKVRKITQEEVDKMLDDANRIKMGDGTHLKNVDLRGYDLRGISFRGRELRRVLFDNSCLNNTDFIRAKITGCSFAAAIMNEACFRAADIRNCSFCNAKMKNLDAIMSKIYLSSFEGANLEDAEFTQSNISCSVFDDAKMRTVKVGLATIGDSTFAGCDLFGVDFSMAYLNNRSMELLRKARVFNLENLDR